MSLARCVKCRFAEFQHTDGGRLKHKAPGRCTFEVPAAPVVICMSRPPRFTKDSIWTSYEGRCDWFQPIEVTP